MSKRPSKKSKPESLYGQFQEFLRSPIWILPVMSFIEQRSLVFDKDQEDEKVFKEIHEEFKEMIDMLIGCFCEDIGVKPEDVVNAVTQAAPNAKNATEKNIIEPVIATQDYDVFLHMMMRKNIELQLQALHILEVVYGIVPAILVPGGSGHHTGQKGDPHDHEQIIMIEVIRKSQEEHDQQKHMIEKDRERLKKAIRESLSEKERLEKERREEEEMLAKALQLSLKENTPVMQPDKEVKKNASAVLPEKKENTPAMEPEKAVKQKGPVVQMAKDEKTKPSPKAEAKVNDLGPVKATHKREAPPKPPAASKSPAEQVPRVKSAGIDKPQLKEKVANTPEDLESRKKYLLEQRNRLLEMKRTEREKAFKEAESDESKPSRPRTAKAARNAMAGLRSTGMSQDVLEARKALADKLKTEIVRM